MEHRTKCLISAAVVLSAVTYACENTPVDAPIPIVGIDPIATRHENVVATAQSVQVEGDQGLINDGMDSKVIKSQRFLLTGWNYELMVNNAPQRVDYREPCDVTVMSAQEIGGYILMGATHCASTEFEINRVLPQAEAANLGKLVSVNDMQMLNIHFDNATLQRNQFGVSTWTDTGVESNPSGSDGISFYFIPNESLDQAERTWLDKTAIQSGDVLLDPVPEGATFSSYCTPAETGHMPVVIRNAAIVSQDQNEANIGPALVGPGCSGAGVFAEIPGNGVKLVSVAIGAWPTNPDKYDQVGTYKFSALGLDGIRTQIQAAKADYEARAGK